MKPSRLVLALALMLSACGQPNDTKAQDGGGLAEPTRRAPESQGDMQASFAPVVQVSAPAVVNISAQTLVRQRDPFFEMFGRGAPRARVAQSVGSGVIVRSDGIVVTNNHVINGAQQILVTLNDRREFPADIVLQDPRSDLAVLRLDTGGERLPVLAIGDEAEVQIGDLVLAIGNPFGIGQTVTSGIISALNRTDGGEGATAYLQTDAAINQGNSGGALVDMDGDLIGINSMILSPSGTSAGIGLAIPASMVRRVVESAAGGETAVVRPWLGVSASIVTADIAREIGLNRPRGVRIDDVYRGGPAASAGVRAGDVITAIGGVEIDDVASMNYRVGVARPGDTVELTVFRDGNERTVRAEVEAPPGDPTPQTFVLGGRNPFSGAQVADLSPALADQLGADPVAGGVILAGVSGRSYAAASGFRRGDIIRSINGQRITSVRQLEQLLSQAQRGWQVTIVRDGREITGRF